MDLNSADYELVWPRDLFVAEAGVALARTGGPSSWVDFAELVLAEAFAGPTPLDDFRAAASRDVFGGLLSSGNQGTTTQRDWMSSLVRAAPQLNEASGEPPAYWSRRQKGGVAQSKLSLEEVMNRFVRLVEDDLLRSGYLEALSPRRCVDDEYWVDPDPSGELQRLLGEPDLWPPSRSRARWDIDRFLDLVEVVHDYVARPRTRSDHDYGGCGWHFANLAREPGRQLYRWRINRLFAASDLPYRLADSGDDCGRVVVISDEARTDLSVRMTKRSDPSTADRVRQAIAIYRARGATRDDKRTAVRELADVLEYRRDLLKDHLAKRDEADLFQIANQFAIRHYKVHQQQDYDAAFLDWLFWWYLATVDLTDHLIARAAINDWD